VLRYVAAIDVRAGKAKVGLESFAPKHAFASISLTDNIVQFETGRYCDNPLIIRGPGAGPAVTAGGLYVPDELPRLEASAVRGESLAEIAAEVLAPFFEGSGLEEELATICGDA